MARTLKSIDAPAAARLMEEGAVMIDVRESAEHARSRIPGSRNVALSCFGSSELPLQPGRAVVFFCASGNRTSLHAARLVDKAGTAEAYVMEGGLSAWSRAGLPVESDSRQSDDGRADTGFFSRLFSR